MVVDMKRVVIITGHFPDQKRQSSILWVSRHLQDIGWHVTHVTVGYSWLSYLKSDARLKALEYKPKQGLHEVSKSLTAIYGVPPIHPIRTGYPTLDKAIGSLQSVFVQFWRKRLHTPLAQADLVICESGAPVLLAPVVAEYAPKAARIYRVNDDIQLLNAPNFLLEAEFRNSKLFTRISSANPALLKRFRHKNSTLDPMGIPTDLLKSKSPSPFFENIDQKKVICAGTTQLDYDALDRIAKQQPNWQIHILGRTKQIPDSHQKNLHFHGELSFEKVLGFVAHADIGLAPYIDKVGVEYQTTNSNRMLLYRHFGLPILGPDRLKTPTIPNIIGYSDPSALDRCEISSKRPEPIHDWSVLAKALAQNDEILPPTEVS
jgi:2-beta-glucuronyltransferase